MFNGLIKYRWFLDCFFLHMCVERGKPVCKGPSWEEQLKKQMPVINEIYLRFPKDLINVGQRCPTDLVLESEWIV